MSDDEVFFQGATLNTLELLTQQRHLWEPLHPKLVGDYLALESALRRLTAVVPDSTEALHLARVAALDAALPVLGGIRALHLDGHHPTLHAVAGHTRDSLDALEHLILLDALHELYFRAVPLSEELAAEMVTVDERLVFIDALKTYARQITSAQRTEPQSATPHHVQHYLQAVRTALQRLDARVPRLANWIPNFVIEYFRLRKIADAGADPGPAAAAPSPAFLLAL